MDRRKYEALLSIIDHMIETSEPRRAEYFKGYSRGIQFRVLGIVEETVKARFPLHDSYSVDPYLDAYARGYRDGCRGLKPEEPPSKVPMST